MKARAAAVEAAVAAAAVIMALGVGAAVILGLGHDPFRVYGVFFSEALLEPLGLGQVLFKTTTLVFTGVSVAFAFRAGMFNIGGEGQMYLGAFACSAAGIFLPSGTPAIIAVPLMIAAGFLGGGLVAAAPAVLKAARGTHEVISTMMLNFVTLAVVNWLLGFIRVPETVRADAVLQSGRLPPFSACFSGMRGSDGNTSLAVALVVCAAVHVFFSRTVQGYETRAVGLSSRAAEYGGVSVARTTVFALVLSGGLAGLAGINFVMGSPGYFEQNFAPYQGYMGIAVALLARNAPLAVLPAAFLFALLSEGSQAIQQFVPKELGEILQAVVIIFVVVGAKVARRRVNV